MCVCADSYEKLFRMQTEDTNARAVAGESDIQAVLDAI